VHALGGPLVVPRPDDDLYAKVIEIATEQAEAASAQTELHRQNVTKMDTMATLLSAQTTTMVGVNTALVQMNEARVRDVEMLKERGVAGVQEIKQHITEKSRNFWIGVAIVALSGASDTILKLVGLLK
jgi:hypothetical protein